MNYRMSSPHDPLHELMLREMLAHPEFCEAPLNLAHIENDLMRTLQYLTFSEVIEFQSVSRLCQSIVTAYARMCVNLLAHKYNLPSIPEGDSDIRKALVYMLRKDVMVIGSREEPRACAFLVDIEQWLPKFKRKHGLEMKRSGDFDCIMHKCMVYAISGSDKMSVGNVEVWNPLTRRWNQFEPLPVPISGCACASDGSHLYVTGGYNHISKCRSDNVYVYNDQKWSDCPFRLPARRNHHAAAYFRGCLYVAGGIVDAPGTVNGISTATRKVDVVDLLTGESRPGPEMVRARYNFSLHAADSGLLAVGGDMEGMVASATSIEWLGNDRMEWLSIFPFNSCIHKCIDCTSALIDTNIFIFGGSNGKEALLHWDSIDLKSGEWVSHGCTDDFKEAHRPLTGYKNGLTCAKAISIDLGRCLSNLLVKV